MAFKRSGVRFPSPPLTWHIGRGRPVRWTPRRENARKCAATDVTGLVGCLLASVASRLPGVVCGNSSVGRAQPCQGWGRGFESRFPLWIDDGGAQAPPFRVRFVRRAGMAKLADARDLKSCVRKDIRVRAPVPALGTSQRVTPFTWVPVGSRGAAFGHDFGHITPGGAA